MGRKSQFPPSVQPGIPRIPKVPSGWKLVPFKDVVRIVQRPVDLEDEQEYQLVTAKRSRGGIVPRERLLGKDILTKTQFYTNSGDFLISRRQIVHGACGIVPTELDNSVVSNEYLVLHTEPKLLKEYLAYFSHTIYFQQTCFHSSIGVDVEKMVFKLEAWLKYKMPLPPIHEQKRIVEILATWDEAIALTERAIEAKQKRKKALMQEFLTGKSKLLGNVTSDKTSLGKYIQLISGQHIDAANCNKYGHGTPYLTGPSDFPEGYINCTKYTEHPKVKCAAGDILLTVKGSGIGSSVIADKDYCISRQLMAIRPTSSSTKFVRYQLELLIEEIRSHAVGPIPGISRNDILNIQIPKISPRLQECIGETLGLADEEIQNLRKQVQQLQKQKQGLMQKLLSGEWRVAVQEAA